MASRINTNKHGDPQQQVFFLSSSKDSGHLSSLPRKLWLGSRMLAELDKKISGGLCCHPLERKVSRPARVVVVFVAGPLRSGL